MINRHSKTIICRECITSYRLSPFYSACRKVMDISHIDGINGLHGQEVCEHTSEGMKQVSSTSKEVASNAVKLHEMVADFKT